VQSWSSLPLSWRVCLINAAVFFVGAIVLVLSPATVSAVRGGAGRAGGGPGVEHDAESGLAHKSLAPVDQLITLMQRVDRERPGSRLTEPSNGSCVGWCGNFNAMVSRLDRANILQKLGMRD
jgi:two-component system, NarL family, sensor histidine kinase UhpB